MKKWCVCVCVAETRNALAAKHREKEADRWMDGWTNGQMNEMLVSVYETSCEQIENQNRFGVFTMFQQCGTCIKRKQELIKSQEKVSARSHAHTKLHFRQSGSNSNNNSQNQNNKTKKVRRHCDSGNEAEATTTKIIILYIYKIY